jgi:curved DNA-binding protein CbpA
VSDRGPARGVDLYGLVGVSPSADGAEIARAYRRRLREVHPDTRPPAGAPGAGAADSAGADPDDAPADLRALQEAYLVLRDPLRRARYDAERLTPGTDHDGGEEPTAGGPRDVRGVPVPVRVRARSFPRRSWWIRVGPVRVEPLPPGRRG